MQNQTSLIYSSETWGFQVSFFWVCKQNPGGHTIAMFFFKQEWKFNLRDLKTDF